MVSKRGRKCGDLAQIRWKVHRGSPASLLVPSPLIHNCQSYAIPSSFKEGWSVTLPSLRFRHCTAPTNFGFKSDPPLVNQMVPLRSEDLFAKGNLAKWGSIPACSTGVSLIGKMWRICPLWPTPEKVRPYTISLTDICNSPTKLVKLQKRQSIVCSPTMSRDFLFTRWIHNDVPKTFKSLSFAPLTFWDGMCWG